MKKFILLLLLISAARVFYMDRINRPADLSSEAAQDDTRVAMKQRMLVFSIDGRTSKGVKQWHLEGKTAEIVDEAIYLKDLNAEAFGEKFTIHLSSNEGVYHRDRSEVELNGEVRVSSDDGTVLVTDRALWSQVTKDITSDTLVRIERHDMTATGMGGHANSEKKTAVLLKNVTVNLEPATLIVCDGPLEASFAENKAVFLNNVKIKDNDGELFSDRLTVYIDEETGRIKEVVAEGNVKLVKGESYTLCGKATYTDSTASVKFIDKPHVVIAPKEIESGGFGLN